MKKVNLIQVGQKFGKLTAIKETKDPRRNEYAWECRCDCGSLVIALSDGLRRGKRVSCGCNSDYNRRVIKPAFKHGLVKSKEYKIWAGMKRRCYNPNEKAYKWYGARGIKVCEEWNNDFSKFLQDMGRCPDGLTIDRIDVNGDYTATNCRWVDWFQQAANRRPRNKNAEA